MLIQSTSLTAQYVERNMKTKVNLKTTMRKNIVINVQIVTKKKNLKLNWEGRVIAKKIMSVQCVELNMKIKTNYQLIMMKNTATNAQGV